ncbi:MAG: hypothetical protein L6Q73_10310 [Aquabacterium sp.]|nr:hypothetical protein [Aquabacterium sp.]
MPHAEVRQERDRLRAGGVFVSLMSICGCDGRCAAGLGRVERAPARQRTPAA